MPKSILVRHVQVSQLDAFERERKRWQRAARQSDKSARITRNDVILLALEHYASRIEAEEVERQKAVK